MSARTGLGLIEVGLLEACESVGAVSNRPHIKSRRILDSLFERTGIGPKSSYEVLCDMTRPWVTHLALIDFHGNHGSPDFGPAAPQYTESRTSPLGVAALAAERGEIGPLPIGLINGNTHVGGLQPPLDPHRLLAAMRAVAAGAGDSELAQLVGLPSFPSNCFVDGELDAFAAGRETQLTLTARVTAVASEQLLIDCIPPDSSPGLVASSLVDQMEHRLAKGSTHPLVDVNDESTSTESRILLTLLPGATELDARSALEQLWAFRRTMHVQFPGPVGKTLRTWVSEHGGSDLEHRLSILESAIRG
jgi:DNA gyrase subunit A